MIFLPEILILLFTYLWGSIPFGYLLTKKYLGKDILKLGSGNIGSTNVRRIAGKRLSIITQLMDMLKGLLPVALFMVFDPTTTIPYYIYLLALAAIIGHDFSLFLKFNGGKGVNTTLGGSVLLAPYAVFISVIVYFIVKWRVRYVSVGSIVIAFTMPIIELIIYGISPTFYYLLICSILIFLRHIKNIIRLINGAELPS